MFDKKAEEDKARMGSARPSSEREAQKHVEDRAKPEHHMRRSTDAVKAPELTPPRADFPPPNSAEGRRSAADVARVNHSFEAYLEGSTEKVTAEGSEGGRPSYLATVGQTKVHRVGFHAVDGLSIYRPVD